MKICFKTKRNTEEISIDQGENILFAGIDLIDNKLTEINITSPTCAVEIFNQTGENPITKIFDSL